MLRGQAEALAADSRGTKEALVARLMQLVAAEREKEHKAPMLAALGGTEG